MISGIAATSVAPPLHGTVPVAAAVAAAIVVVVVAVANIVDASVVAASLISVVDDLISATIPVPFWAWSP